MSTRNYRASSPHWPQVRPPRRAYLLIGLILVALIAGIIPRGPIASAQGGSSIPSSARITGLTHIYQDWNNCGPANLTMALSYYGWNPNQKVAEHWLKPDIEDKNVSPGQMAAFVNQQTELPNIRAIWRYGGTLAMIKRFVAAGFPVIIESGYDVDDLGWMGHYETIVGYDDAQQTFWVFDSYLGNGSDGYGRNHLYSELENWWRHFNRTFIVLYEVDREQEVRAILGNHVDPAYAAESALAIARQEAAADPSDGWAWFNAGTSATKLGRYYDAAIYYDEAFRQGLPYRLMWYQFGPYVAYYNVGRYQDVIELADNVESTTEYVEETRYWRGLALAALGQTGEAVTELGAAVAFNPNFGDAQVALDAVNSGTYVSPGAPQ